MKNPKIKVKCEQVSNFEHGQVVLLRVVPYGAKENESITTQAASGEFQFRIENGTPLHDRFKAGKEYFMSLTDAPKTVIEPVKADKIPTEGKPMPVVN